jgi:hypothetical protein
MKALKIILLSIYVVLIALLLMNRCNRNPIMNIGGDGKMKVTMMWDAGADIDLHVFEPNGTHIYFGHSEDPNSYAYLDVDNQVGGPGSAENIFWESEPVAGNYKIAIHYFKGDKPSVDVKVYVKIGNDIWQKDVVLTRVKQGIHVFDVKIPERGVTLVDRELRIDLPI